MRRPIISVLIGLVLAAAALFLVYNLRTPGQTAEAAAPVLATTTVIVAAENIAFGQAIKADFLKEVAWPADSVPEGAIQSRTEALGDSEGARIALKSIVAGEPILRSKISGYGERPILSRKVPDDKRAYSIRINDVSGVAGFLLPGDHVDVLLTRRIGRANDNYVTDVIIQNVSVLGIDQLASEEEDSPVVARTATIEVSPEQAQKLALAQQLGTLSLTLRGYTDTEQAEITRVTVGDLANDAKTPVRRDDGIYVRVRKGTEVKSERVPQ